ncbi:MAG TPA: DUF4245 family protein [Marmoricola sp.]|nr:DUF4245 family protein [Marmoricola sp.]
MSQSRRPAQPGYQRSFPGLLAAMLVVVLVVVGWTGFRALFSDKETTPVQTVEWQPIVQAAARAGTVEVLAPPSLPHGWRATSADLASDGLHLGLLTDEGKYVGLEERTASLQDLVAQYVDENAQQGRDVRLDGITWQTWTDPGGDYAVGRIGADRGGAAAGARTSYLVVGSAPAAEVRAFAADLQPVVETR